VADFTVKIDSVLWQKPNRGAVVNAILIDGDMPGDDTRRFRIPYSASDDDSIQPGQWWRITGENERYRGDLQIVATEAVILRPSGEHIKGFLAGDRLRFPGIGEAYAERLWDKLGNGLVDLLESKEEFELARVMRDLKIPTPDDLAEIMVAGWADLEIGTVISWLDNLPAIGKFGVKLGRKVCKCWGASARERVEEDAYRLLSFYKDKPRNEWAAWNKVDEIAQRVFGIAKDDERRLHGAVIESIFKAYDNKNTVIDRPSLLEKVKGRLKDESLATEALSRSYGRNSFLHNGEWYQAQGVFLMEKEVAERIALIMRYKKQYKLFGEKSVGEKAIDKGIKEFEAREGYMLGPEQKEAVHLCLGNNLCVITGGAGTGKTCVLKCVYHIIKEAGGEIKQMALAGRAARRMSEATGLPARTIAGFLTNDVTDCHSDNTYVIDEASMLDLPTTFRILRRLPDGCRLILVGDAEQLPPIGPGLVFHLLAKSMVGIVPTVELKRVYRQDGKSGIPAVAAAIRGGQDCMPTLPDLPEYNGLGKGVSVYYAKAGEIAEALMKVYNDLGASDPKADVRVLAITLKDKPHGVDGINKAFHWEYSQGKKMVLGYSEEQASWKAPGQFAEGEPVMWTQNEWDLDLFNGTLGVVEKAYDAPDIEKLDPGEHLSGNINFDTGRRDVTVADLDLMELAYAITVHKSQGSQFKRVIIPIAKEPLLDKALVYTAVTRGVEQVVLVGDIAAARAAVESGAIADRRHVGLGHMLRLAIGDSV
jgi:exodeoxyribonuclease V alpha subunit